VEQVEETPAYLDQDLQLFHQQVEDMEQLTIQMEDFYLEDLVDQVEDLLIGMLAEHLLVELEMLEDTRQ
jgi:hypothetical protein